LISSPGAKSLNLKNLTMLGGSSSRLTASQTRVSDDLHWWVQPNATLTIEQGVYINANRPSDHTGQPCLHIEGQLIWRGGPSQRSGSTLEIMNSHEIVVEQIESVGSTPGAPYEALLTGGISSSPHSILSIATGAVLSTSCPQNMTSSFGCTFGLVNGAGELNVILGVHTMASPINVTHLTLRNGRNEFFEQVHVEQMDVMDGEMILHGYAFVNQVSNTTKIIVEA
jgi:hypothetical protein